MEHVKEQNGPRAGAPVLSGVRIAALGIIFAAACQAWWLLASSIEKRTAASSGGTAKAVDLNWGPELVQPHPVVDFEGPHGGRKTVPPAAGRVDVKLGYEPKRKGLMWHRTYTVDFSGEWEVENPAPIAQTLYFRFRLPDAAASYQDFAFKVGGRPSARACKPGEALVEAMALPPGGRATVAVSYESRGTGAWTYSFGSAARVRGFELRMATDFAEIDFPGGSASPTKREAGAGGWLLEWSYPDVLGPRAVAMAMPSVVNPGPTAARITFYAPVSLLFFFTVLVLAAAVQGVALHPMHFSFLAAGSFAFQLLFAYLVDHVPVSGAFAVASGVSMCLVGGYLWRAAGGRIAAQAAAAQFAYQTLFSYSFFFEGFTGLSITVGAVVTLALLMAATARMDWDQVFAPTPREAGPGPSQPPPLPASS